MEFKKQATSLFLNEALEQIHQVFYLFFFLIIIIILYYFPFFFWNIP